MTMLYRFLWLLGLIWCIAIVNCEEGRSFIDNGLNELKNNAIDLQNYDHIQSTRTENHNNYRLKRSIKDLIKRNLGERYPSAKESNKTFEEAVKFLKDNDNESSKISREINLAQWNYDSNLTAENQKKMLEASLKGANFNLKTYNEAKTFGWKQFNDTYIKRWFRNLVKFNELAVGEQKFQELNLIQADLTDIYSKAKVCKYNSKTECNLALEPELTLLLKETTDYDELKYYWTEWRNQSGKKMKSKYLRYVELSNEMANKNGFNDMGELWRENYQLDDEQFETELEEQLKKIQPLYRLIHAYVRKRLRKIYPNQILSDGPIPAHILGNMWAQDWTNVDILRPYPDRRSKVNLKEKNLTAHDMFKLSESFFVSLGLPKLPSTFWNLSIIEKPKDRELVCHASAWDFNYAPNGEKDVRIKMCTRIELEDLITIHHEQGHIYYYLAYAKQPGVFREGANSGFHEAIGDCIALSVQTPKHLKAIGLLKNETTNDDNCKKNENEICGEKKDEINFLMQIALEKLAFLPFGYLIDKWRWDVFAGRVKEDQLNSHWWKLRQEYQGLCPPTLRTEDDFDPGAKYHVPASVPYLRYFVAHILQFQFHKALCDESGYTGSLDQCDIYNSKKAGTLLQKALELGSSISWNSVLKVFTNGKDTKLNSQPLIDYFEPLIKWLKENELKDEPIGWNIENPNICPNH